MPNKGDQVKTISKKTDRSYVHQPMQRLGVYPLFERKRKQRKQIEGIIEHHYTTVDCYALYKEVGEEIMQQR
jgi:hypothetical protein